MCYTGRSWFNCRNFILPEACWQSKKAKNKCSEDNVKRNCTPKQLFLVNKIQGFDIDIDIK